MNVLIIGFGNMGQTYANSFVSSGFVLPQNIYVLNRSEVQKKKQFSVPKENYFLKPEKNIFDVDIVILAVKPQDFNDLSNSIASYITNEHIVLSVMAGISIESIKSKLNCTKVVRSMPNIPTQIGQGMTVFSTSNEVDRKELFVIQNLINTTGKSISVEDENMLNAATAISGSGPAYVYFFMEAMINAAVELGFTSSEATFLVNQTFSGAVQLQNRSSLSHEEWIQKVASKGGTTEAALKIFDTFEVKKEIMQGIFEANERSKQLGKIFEQ